MIVNVFSNVGNTWDLDTCGFVTSIVVGGKDLTESDIIAISKEAIHRNSGMDVGSVTPQVVTDPNEMYKLFETANVNINTDLGVNYFVLFGSDDEIIRPYTLLIIT